MKINTVALLGVSDSPVSDRLRGLLAGMDIPARMLDLDAPLQGEPVTVRGDEVIWQGFALHTAAVVWIEKPVFPWPQMLPPPFPLPDVENFNRWRNYQREAQALAVSALATASESATVVNPPWSAHLAVAPITVLDKLADGGIPVAPWRVGSVSTDNQEPVVAIDATGHDRRHPAGALPPDAPRLVFPSLGGEVMDVLLIGREIAGCRRWSDPAAWTSSEPAQLDTSAPDQAADLASCVASTLALEIVQVSCVGGGEGPAVMTVDAAPDFNTWDTQLDGAPGSILAHRLAALARVNQGERP
ncbi:MAG: hypothetical protein ABFS42_13235 [Candidatus Krumholzibacteriota bacterium]